MNKAEEQFLYIRDEGWCKTDLMSYAYDTRITEDDFISYIKDYCNNTIEARRPYPMGKAVAGYLSSIIHAIDGGQIKDWPSFVEYMTGEDYAQKPKCEYCNDTKEVPAPHYSSKGEPPDCDFIKCPKCGGDKSNDE